MNFGDFLEEQVTMKLREKGKANRKKSEKKVQSKI